MIDNSEIFRQLFSQIVIPCGKCQDSEPSNVLPRIPPQVFILQPNQWKTQKLNSLSLTFYSIQIAISEWNQIKVELKSFLTGNKIHDSGQEYNHRGNEQNHPIVIHSLLVRKIKSSRKRIGIASSHIHGQRIKPPVAAERPPRRVGRKHNVQADNHADKDDETDGSHGSHQQRSLKLAPCSVFFTEALVLALGHERLAKRVADYLHLKRGVLTARSINPSFRRKWAA